MLRPSFVPPAEIRQLRDYTRLRIDLTRERTRYWQRLKKLLEDALIKVSSVASTMTAKSVRDMLEALIAGERETHRLAEVMHAERTQAKRGALIEALNGRFDAHHGVLARVLLNQIDVLNVEITALTERINDQLATITAVAEPQTRRRHRLQAKPAATGCSCLCNGLWRGRRYWGELTRPGHHRRDRHGHDAISHRGTSVVVGQAVAAHRAIRNFVDGAAGPATATPIRRGARR